MELNPKRLDGNLAAGTLRLSDAAVFEDEGVLTLILSTDPFLHDIDIRFPAPNGVVQPAWLNLAKEVLKQLSGLDYQVQEASLEESHRSGLDARFFVGELAFIRFTSPDNIVLRYYATGCNSEWDESFVREGAHWKRTSPS